MVYILVNLIFLFILDVQARCCGGSCKSKDAQHDKNKVIREKYNDKNKLMRSGRVKEIIDAINVKDSNDPLYNEYLENKKKIAEEDRNVSLLNKDQKIEIVNNAIYNFLKIVYESKEDNMDIYDFPKPKEDGDKSKEEVDKSKEEGVKSKEEEDKPKEGEDKLIGIVLDGLERIGYKYPKSTARTFRTMMEKIMGNFGIVSKALSGLNGKLDIILNFFLQEDIVIKINPNIFDFIYNNFIGLLSVEGYKLIKGFYSCSNDDKIDQVLGFDDVAYDKFIIELETRKASETEKDTFLVIKRGNGTSGGYSDFMEINIKKLKDNICRILEFYFEILHVFYIYKEILKKELYVYYFNEKIYIYTPKVSSINKDFEGVLPANLCGDYTKKYRLNDSLLSNIIIDLPIRQDKVSVELEGLSKAYGDINDINDVNGVNGADQDKENRLNVGREKLEEINMEIMFFDEFCKKLNECIIGQRPSKCLDFNKNKFIFTNTELAGTYFCKLDTFEDLLSKNVELKELYNDVKEKYWKRGAGCVTF